MTISYLSDLGLTDVNSSVVAAHQVAADQGTALAVLDLQPDTELVLQAPATLTAVVVNLYHEHQLSVDPASMAGLPMVVCLWTTTQSIPHQQIPAQAAAAIHAAWASLGAMAAFSPETVTVVTQTYGAGAEAADAPEKKKILGLLDAFEGEIVRNEIPAPRLLQVQYAEDSLSFVPLTSTDALRQVTVSGDQVTVRALLLIHGTGGDAEMAFKKLVAHPYFQKTYGTDIIAFNHANIRPSVRQNVSDLIGLLQELSAGRRLTLEVDIITRSRGGLVFCELLRQLVVNAVPDQLITLHIRKAVMVAPPLLGTPVAGFDQLRLDAHDVRQLIDQYEPADILLELLGEVMYKKMYSMVEVIQDQYHAMEGLQAMLPVVRNPYLQELLADIGPYVRAHQDAWYSLVAHYTRPGADSRIQAIFEGADNDYIVPVEGARGGDAWALAPGHFFTFASAKTSHLGYFKHKNRAQKLSLLPQELEVNQVVDWLKA
ncbi:MAG: hypothetical protein SF053_04870 [Bacteroidia bacterium]|nr:hypothetical protein [Bacteroidia bacterium]